MWIFLSTTANASLLGVFQVTLFCSGLCRTGLITAAFPHIGGNFSSYTRVLAFLGSLTHKTRGCPSLVATSLSLPSSMNDKCAIVPVGEKNPRKCSQLVLVQQCNWRWHLPVSWVRLKQRTILSNPHYAVSLSKPSIQIPIKGLLPDFFSSAWHRKNVHVQLNFFSFHKKKCSDNSWHSGLSKLYILQFAEEIKCWVFL